MFSTWMTLRQAEEALKHGRLDEAWRLASLPEVQGHRRAAEVLKQTGQALLTRAQLHLRHDDPTAAWKDLRLAEAAGKQDKTALALRQELVQRGLTEVRSVLEAGEPERALEAIERLQENAVDHLELKTLEEMARNWSLAQELAVRGELGPAVVALERTARLAGRRWPRLEEARRDLERRRGELDKLLAKLHEALQEARWREVIHLADQVLGIAPQHAETRRARSRAWKAVEPPTVTVAPVPEAEAVPPRREEPCRRMLLWIDGVGGYLVCLSSRVSFGQATPDAYVDIPLYADISRLHGYLTRDPEGYLLEAVRPVSVNQQVTDKALLRDGDRLTIGQNCQLRFRQPLPVSATARLEVASGHRLPVSVDGVLLMADTCILGPTREAHIVIPDLRRPIVLFRRPDGFRLQAAGKFQVDGVDAKGRADLGPHATAAAEDFRLTLEPLGPHLGKSRV